MFFGAFLLGNVRICDEIVVRFAFFISYERPTAHNNDLLASAGRLSRFGLPFVRFVKSLFSVANKFLVFGTKNIAYAAAESVFRRPSVYAFGAFVPVQDLTVEIAHEDRVLSFIEK